MMYTVEQIMQAIGTLDGPQKDRLIRALDVSQPQAAPQWGALAEPDYVLIYDGGDEERAGGFVIASPRGQAPQMQHHLPWAGQSVHEADYDALIAGLEHLASQIAGGQQEPGHYTVEVRGPSRLVTQQLLGLWRAGSAHLEKRRQEARHLLGQFGGYRLVEIPGSQVSTLLGR